MSERKDDGGQAFPSGDYDGGMSLRDWFAGQALAGACSSHEHHAKFDAEGNFQLHPIEFSSLAARAYLFADAMIVESTK